MKIMIEINTLESSAEDAEKLRQIANMLEGAVASEEKQSALPPPTEGAPADTTLKKFPKKKPPFSENKKTSALQFQLKNTAHSLNIQNKEIFYTWRDDVIAKYGTGVIDELPVADLPKLIEELENLLDNEK